jgi:hypothetical protein
MTGDTGNPEQKERWQHGGTTESFAAKDYIDRFRI